jgi:hypothetical protein
MTRRFSHGGHKHGYQCVLIDTVFGRHAVAVMTGSDKGDPVIGSLLAAVRENVSWPDLPISRDGPTWWQLNGKPVVPGRTWHSDRAAYDKDRGTA